MYGVRDGDGRACGCTGLGFSMCASATPFLSMSIDEYLYQQNCTSTYINIHIYI